MSLKKLNPVMIYLTVSFVTSIANRLYLTTSAIYRVQVVGLDALQLVLVGTVLEMTVFLFEIPTGVVADLNSRRLSFIIGMFVVGLGFMVEGFVPIFWVVLLAQFIWGLGWTFMSGAYQAWLTDEIGVDAAGATFVRGQRYALIGSLATTPLVVWAANQSLALPFLVGGGLRILLGFFLIAFMPETGFKRTPKEERETWGELWHTVRKGFDLMRGKHVLVLFAVISLLVGLYSEGWDRLNEPHLLANFAFPSLFGLQLGAVEWFALISLVWNLVGIATNRAVEMLVDTTLAHRVVSVLQSFYLVMVLAMITFALTGNFWLALLAMLVFDTLRDLTYPLQSAWVNRHIDSDVRATVLSMTGQIDAFGQMASGPVIGLVGRVRSLPAAILTAAGILFPVVPLFGFLRRSEGDAIPEGE